MSFWTGYLLIGAVVSSLITERVRSHPWIILAVFHDAEPTGAQWFVVHVLVALTWPLLLIHFLRHR